MVSDPLAGLRNDDADIRSLKRDRVYSFHNTMTVVETDELRLLIDAEGWLTTYPKTAGARSAFGRATVCLDSCGELRVGRPWTFAFLDLGDKVIRTTAPVITIRQVSGGVEKEWLRESGDLGVEIRRTRVNVLWGASQRGPGVTVRIRTTGTWEGEWLLHAGGLADIFLPLVPHESPREWSGLWLESHARIGATLWLGYEVAPGVWCPVDESGCGSVVSIEVLEALS